eukprot:GHRQ01038559.1.p2 GENE.GHRQ01038559.1~~GHRQ01038559.1.p2  ORF type:complete len:206 (+),score=90.42 GHRQ01038559.1:743-1360(+)
MGVPASTCLAAAVPCVNLQQAQRHLALPAMPALGAASYRVPRCGAGACVGAGVDLITAADLRYCSQDAYFSVKEVDLAITADLGTLQRLPCIIGHGAAAELALTGRSVPAREAAQLGLVSRVAGSATNLAAAVMQLAAEIAAKSPLAVAGTKAVLLHTRDHGSAGGVAGGLAHVALWNSAYLLSGDMAELLAALVARRPPAFSKL